MPTTTKIESGHEFHIVALEKEHREGEVKSGGADVCVYLCIDTLIEYFYGDK